MFDVPASFRRTASIALLASFTAAGGLLAPHVASAQARPASTRDVDNPDLAPAFFTGSFGIGTQSTVTTVPAGKRLMIDAVSYDYVSGRSGDQLNFGALYVVTAQGNSQVRLYLPINPPHAYVASSGSTAQDAAFPTRVIFEAGEAVLFIASNTSNDVSRSVAVTLTGHYVTP